MVRKLPGVLVGAAMLFVVGCSVRSVGWTAADAPASAGSSQPSQSGSVTTTTVTSDSDGPAPVSTSGATQTVRALPNEWVPAFTEQFKTATVPGKWPGAAYADRWMSYDGFEDTAGTGTYDASKVLSVHDGALDMFLHDRLVAAPVPLVTGKWGGQLYGRFTLRFKADRGLDGIHAAWLLWPDSEDHADGEIDFPEGDLDGRILGYNHCLGKHPGKNCMIVHSGVAFADGKWHTAVIEWRPESVSFILDGRTLGVSDVSPVKKMHWVLQTETTKAMTAAVSGHVYVDSVQVDKYVALPGPAHSTR